MLITHGLVATLGKDNHVIQDGAILIEDGKITEVGATGEMKNKYPSAEELDADGMLVLPGAICAHTHFYGAFARGMYIPGEPARNFVQILEKLWWRLDLALDDEGTRLSALVCLADAIRHGTTTLMDHHASPNAIEGSLDIIAEAVKQSGLRACLCYEVTDRNGDEGAKAGIAENVRFARAQAQDGSPNLKAMFGLHAAFTVSDRTLEHCVGEAQMLGVGFHTHLAEDAADEDDSLRKYEMRIARRFLRRGVLGTKDHLRARRPPGRKRVANTGRNRNQADASAAQQHEQRRRRRPGSARARLGRVRGAGQRRVQQRPLLQR